MMFDHGDVIRLKTTIEELGTAADPGTLVLTILKPDGSTVTYTYGTDADVVRNTTGVYYVDYEIDQPGRHRYSWTSTGAAQAYEKETFDVRSQNP